jgi:hypothetical protein
MMHSKFHFTDNFKDFLQNHGLGLLSRITNKLNEEYADKALRRIIDIIKMKVPGLTAIYLQQFGTAVRRAPTDLCRPCLLSPNATVVALLTPRRRRLCLNHGAPCMPHCFRLAL